MTYFKEHKNGRLICLLCSHYCKLKAEQAGICGVNKNTNNAIECLVYGRIDALNVDPIEKKPLYHFLPNTKSLSLGTVGCNFRCDFCQNWQLSQRSDFTKERYLSPDDVVNLALQHQCKTISYTYNEPTIFYPFAKDIAQKAQKHGIKSIFVSNGFESQEVIEDMAGVIDAINVDLKSFNDSYYKKVLKGDLKTILQNLKTLHSLNIHLEITTLIIPTQNDSDEEIDTIIHFIKEELGDETPWHISAFHPNYKRLELPSTSKQTLINIYEKAKNIGLKHVYMGNIGIENPTTCLTCKTTLIQRQHFGVTQNILKNGSCPKCNTKLQGVYHD